MESRLRVDWNFQGSDRPPRSMDRFHLELVKRWMERPELRSLILLILRLPTRCRRQIARRKSPSTTKFAMDSSPKWTMRRRVFLRKAATEITRRPEEFTPFSSDLAPGQPADRTVSPPGVADLGGWPQGAGFASSFPPGTDQAEQPCPPGLDPASPFRAPASMCEAFFSMPPMMPMGFPPLHCEFQAFDPRVQKLLCRPHAGATTIIVQIIPNKVTQRTLLNVWKDLGFGGCIDLFYLPMDFRKKRNIGYGYVNFTTETEAMIFESKVHGMQVPNVNSPKRLTATKAKEQGFCANFWKIWEAAKKRGRCPPECRPLILDPDTGEEIEFPVPLDIA
mmetsp:Transcript_11064/g.27957  ORF Transcript_11064/g.27957 Transcript_11064/m.27957 type:complete len:335 (+) Transcript_11064:248-1252(+)